MDIGRYMAEHGHEMLVYCNDSEVGLKAVIAVHDTTLGPALGDFVRKPNYTHFESAVMRLLAHISPKREIPLLSNHVPSGFFDNAPLERWLRSSFERTDTPNDFREFARKRGCQLYVSACDLDTAERVTFGAASRASAPSI